MVRTLTMMINQIPLLHKEIHIPNFGVILKPGITIYDARTDFSHQQERTNSTKCNASTRGYRNESVPSHAEARQWMKQAKLDLKAALKFLPRAEDGPTFNWICYMCYQVYICFTDKGYCGRDHMITVFTFTFQ